MLVRFHTIKIKFRKLHPDAVLPAYAKPGDAGLDLVAIDHGKMEAKSIVDNVGPDEVITRWAEYREYKTGIAVEIPEGYVGLVFPRSSISNTAMALSNAVGVIDSGYRGEILFRFRVLNDYPIRYNKGDKIGQLVIVPYPQIEPEWADALSDTVRGEGGFGSSDGKPRC